MARPKDSYRNIDYSQLLVTPTDAPQIEAEGGILQLFMNLGLRNSFVISDPSFSVTDGRIEMITYDLIATLIPNEDMQNELFKELETAIAEAKKEGTNEEKGKKCVIACEKIKAKVYGRLHNITGTTKENRVGIIWNPVTCEVIDGFELRKHDYEMRGKTESDEEA